MRTAVELLIEPKNEDGESLGSWSWVRQDDGHWKGYYDGSRVENLDRKTSDEVFIILRTLAQ